MSILLQFVYLQILDILTTMAFLVQGVGEANPVVRWAIAIAPNAVTGLVIVKLFAIGFALICVYRSSLFSNRKMSLQEAGEGSCGQEGL